ncbi:MAG: CDP-alcohol phosphatidyltransferase family protein [Simkaniaceae bacterium]|nr:CDP-alcohol phosphatidyltransferase family protein [Simkaniaceae bacterium]
MRQIYIVPNILTAFGLACGLFVIFKVNMVEPGFSNFQLLYSSTLLLLVAALADLLDGAIARAIHAESEFGFVFDSLADAISFGVAPSVLMLKSLSLENGTGISFYAAVGAMLYSLCGVLRLVRFNVKTTESKQDEAAKKVQKSNFSGLPIPAAAAAVVSLNLFLHSPVGLSLFPMSVMTRAIILSSFMIVIGYLMICKWKFPSLKTFNFKVPSFHLIFVCVVVTIFLLYGILNYFSIVLLAISMGYVLTGCILTMIRLIAGSKSKTLVDFEIDHEEHDSKGPSC